MSESPSCKSRWASEKNDRIRDIRKLWKLYTNGEDQSDPDLGRFDEYGLAFDYVAPNTFSDQPRGYWRWQISYGGPSDEFRFHGDGPRHIARIEYTFLDWFDGYTRKLMGNDEALLREIWDSYFEESGAAQAEFDKAMGDE